MANNGLKISDMIYTSLESAINDDAQVPVVVTLNGKKTNRKIDVITLQGQGPQGDIGIGVQGPQGDIGIGVQGPQGDIGIGVQGPQGLQGASVYNDMIYPYTTNELHQSYESQMVLLGTYTPILQSDSRYITIQFCIYYDNPDQSNTTIFEGVYRCAYRNSAEAYVTTVLICHTPHSTATYDFAASYNTTTGNLYFIALHPDTIYGYKLLYKVSGLKSSSLFTESNQSNWINFSTGGYGTVKSFDGADIMS